MLAEIHKAPRLLQTISAAVRNYARYPGVCGISFGTKIKDGRPLDDTGAVQFFVTKKRDKSELSKTLPKTVYLRTEAGAIDPAQTVRTDVIELQNLQLCCFSGDRVRNTLDAAGSIALVFENKANANALTLVTCSHVASDLVSADEQFSLSGGQSGCFFEGRTEAFTTISEESLTFDVALARLTPHGNLTPLQTRNGSSRFRRFAPANAFQRNAEFDAQSFQQGRQKLKLLSAATTFEDIDADDAGSINVSNLFACRGEVERGDSGGVVFLGDDLVGFIVAKAESGWVLIHAFEPALAHLAEEAGIPIQVFDSEEQ